MVDNAGAGLLHDLLWDLNRQQFQVLMSLSSGKKDFWNIVVDVNGTIRDLFVNLDFLKNNGLIIFESGFFSLKYPDLISSIDFNSIKNDFSGLSAQRPSAIIDFFQAALGDDDIFKRLRFIYERGDLFGKAIFLIGDDDLFSVALALTGLPKRVVVGEIDERVIGFIERISSDMGLEIEVFRYNCADVLPERYAGRFDVFICDPVETEKGFSAFISRGVAALRHPGAVYFGLTETECPFHIWHKMQADFNSMNLVCTDILRKFSFYPVDSSSEESAEFYSLRISKISPFDIGAPSRTWYNSALFRLETVDVPIPLVKEGVVFDKSFYDNEYVMTVRDK